MLNDITLGQYFPGDSLLHRLDPRTKILSSIALITAVFLADHPSTYAFITCFSLGLVALSGVPIRFVAKSLKPLFWIILFTFAIHAFVTPGTILWQWGILKVSQEGLSMGFFMSLRLILLLLISSLLTLTTSPIVLTDGIEQLMAPLRRFGVPAHELAMMMTIALRFIPTLLEETDRIMKAQTARGARFDSGGLMARAKSLVPLLVPLFISAFRRADELATAMEARCYRGGDQRTRLKVLSFQQRDYGTMLIVLSMIMVLFGLRWYL